MKLNNIKIFKNSEKFLVFKKKTKNNNFCVYKISHKNPVKIFSEIKLLKDLVLNSKILSKYIPKILKYGIIKKGIHKNKGYYIIEFISGITFTQLVQKKKYFNTNFKLIINFIFKEFARIVRENKFTFYKEKSSVIIKKLMIRELKKMEKKDLIFRFLKQKKLKIDDNVYNNIDFYLRRIFKSKPFLRLDEQKNFLSKIGHWNFHGGNIIFPTIKKFKNFYLIDPDATWNINDPFFSLARFIYTYPHDTLENNKYYIFSKYFKNINYSKANFKIIIRWNKKVKKNYEKNFSKFYNLKKKNIHFNSLNRYEIFRLKISLILCLLRGINSNFQNEIKFVDNQRNKFQNHGVFLLLILTKYLKSLNNNINEEY